MSYILEALKKSQQERELGQVPRIEGVVFDDSPLHAPRRGWGYAALLLAVVAVASGAYIALRGGVAADADIRAAAAPEPAPAAASAGSVADIDGEPRTTRPPEGPTASTPLPAPVAAPPPAPEPVTVADAPPAPRVEAPPSPTVPEPTPAPASKGLDTPESRSVEPQVLVVPAPPKPGQPLPRGADELRRAVLGPDSSPSVDVKPTNTASAPPPPEHAPVPDDLIADIEAFKKQMHTAPAKPASPAVPAPPDLLRGLAPPTAAADNSDAVPPLASLSLRGKLPDFKMMVHVYDADPTRRFVYINGRKLGEHQKSKEGLKLERVLPDGAVLSYQGEEFFQPR
jgi:general secretion pathway protein B